MVETSPMSHVVTIPTFSFHHHHHPPPPPPCAAATAAVERPGDCPRVGQPGAGSSTPRHPDDDPNDALRPCLDPQTASLVDATSPRRRPRRRPSILPRHPPTMPIDDAILFIPPQIPPESTGIPGIPPESIGIHRN